MNAYPMAPQCAGIAVLFLTLWWHHRRWWTRPLAAIGALLLTPIVWTLLT